MAKLLGYARVRKEPPRQGAVPNPSKDQFCLRCSSDVKGLFSPGDLGGVLVLHAVFPVTGDTSRIASCDVSLTNSAGNAKTPRISF